MANLDFTNAFKYPFRRWVGLLNILWVLVPIYGWFLLIGYRVRILAEQLDGKYKQLPLIKHGSDFKLGWVMFWKMVPGIAVLIVGGLLTGGFEQRPNEVLTALYLLLILLIVPTMALNFIRKRTIASYFEFDLIRKVTKNLGDYCIALLKDLALGLLFLVMIVILVGLPAAFSTKGIFMTEFYRTHVKK